MNIAIICDVMPGARLEEGAGSVELSYGVVETLYVSNEEEFGVSLSSQSLIIRKG
jgi:hypothetical protein